MKKTAAKAIGVIIIYLLFVFINHQFNPINWGIISKWVVSIPILLIISSYIFPNEDN